MKTKTNFFWYAWTQSNHEYKHPVIYFREADKYGHDFLSCEGQANKRERDCLSYRNAGETYAAHFTFYTEKTAKALDIINKIKKFAGTDYLNFYHVFAYAVQHGTRVKYSSKKYEYFPYKYKNKEDAYFAAKEAQII